MSEPKDPDHIPAVRSNVDADRGVRIDGSTNSIPAQHHNVDGNFGTRDAVAPKSREDARERRDEAEGGLAWRDAPDEPDSKR